MADPNELDAFRRRYLDLIGLVPPRIEARIQFGSEVDPKLLKLMEEMRAYAMYPDSLDIKTTQLILFGMLLNSLASGARFHALAARRAGASWEELNAVTGLAFLFRGLSAANLGAEILQGMKQAEKETGPTQD